MSNTTKQNNNSSIQEYSTQEILSCFFDQSDIDDGIKVAVYFNLHKDLFSVMSRQGSTYGKVLFHTDNIILSDVTFVVRPKGREKVIKDKRKNVHAFCYGYIDIKDKKEQTKGRLISYNPYKAAHFYYKDDLSKAEGSDKIKMEVTNNKGKIWECLNEKKT